MVCLEARGGNDVDGEPSPEGYQAVRAAYAAVFAQYPDAHWGLMLGTLRRGDRGVSEWTHSPVLLKDGKRVEVTGCDLFTFSEWQDCPV